MRLRPSSKSPKEYFSLLIRHVLFLLFAFLLILLVQSLDECDFDSLRNSLCTTSEPLSQAISDIIRQIRSNVDAQSATNAILQQLSDHEWGAKVVIALASLAVAYGEYTMLMELRFTHNTAKRISLLKQLPTVFPNSLRRKLDAVDRLIRGIVGIVRLIVEVGSINSRYISDDVVPMRNARGLVPLAAYWSVRSIVTCACHVMGPLGLDHEFIRSTTDAWEIASLEHMQGVVHRDLSEQLALCRLHIETEEKEESYKVIVELLETRHTENSKSLKKLLNPNDDPLPLYNCNSRSYVTFDDLKNKNVLLLVTNTDVTSDYITMVEGKVVKNKSHSEIIWLPLSSTWTPHETTEFRNFQTRINCYTLSNPVLKPTQTRFFTEFCSFRNKPLIAVIDPHGSVVHPNALPMVWIWGGHAFPFTVEKEESLVKAADSSLSVLSTSVVPHVKEWNRKETLVCFYGGDDAVWVRKFTAFASGIAKTAGIRIRLVYVGKSKVTASVEAIHEVVRSEEISESLQDSRHLREFWLAVESLWLLKEKYGCDTWSDSVTREIANMLSFDAGECGWSVFWYGGQFGKGKGEEMIRRLDGLTVDQETDSNNRLSNLVGSTGRSNRCDHLILPFHHRNSPRELQCADCGALMEKLVLFCCCVA